MKTYLIVEDKDSEQASALSAIKASLNDVTEGGVNKPLNPGDLISCTTIRPSDGQYSILFTSDPDTAIRWIEMHARQGRIDGVLTDLMMPRGPGAAKEEPWGLEVIASCIKTSTPVVVCSDAYHHDVDYLRGIMPILGAAHPKGRIPMVLDKKDWPKAFSLLRELTV
jgi:CheY-like chemotaxis protein